MKYILGIIAAALMITLFPLQSVAEEHEPPECQLPEGCDWRTTIVIRVEKEGVENWVMEWNSPRQDFVTNLQHNYLLLERIFGRDDGATEPALMSIVRQLGVAP